MYAGAWMVAMSFSKSQRGMFLSAAATTLTLGVMLAMLEIPAAFNFLDWSSVFRRLSGEGVPNYRSSYVPDPELSFRRVPAIHWTGRPYSDIEEGTGLPRSLKRSLTFTYDRWGYRNSIEMPQADIVFVGDSFVEGWYVSDDETTAAVLGHRLRIPVANLGVAGYGTLQELRIVQGDAMQRHPRVLIWYLFEGNDLYDDQGFENAMLAPPHRSERNTPDSLLARLNGWDQRSFITNALVRLRRLTYPLFPLGLAVQATLPEKNGGHQQVYFGGEAAVPWTSYEEQRWLTASRAFQTGVAFARDRGVHPILVFVPHKYRVYRDFITDPRNKALKGWKVGSEFPSKFKELCATVNVPCVDATPVLIEALRNNIMVYSLTDTHWSAEGHTVIARELERRLKELGWVPET